VKIKKCLKPPTITNQKQPAINVILHFLMLKAESKTSSVAASQQSCRQRPGATYGIKNDSGNGEDWLGLPEIMGGISEEPLSSIQVTRKSLTSLTHKPTWKASQELGISASPGFSAAT